MSRKLYISILSFGIFIIIFGTVTYAWITIATINNIEGLSLSASTGDELQISTDGYHFSSVLDAQALVDIFENQSLTDVTTLDGKDFFTGGLAPKEDAVKNRDYVSFELWFRTTKKERHVYLINNVSDLVSYDVSMEGTYVISKGVLWKSNVDFLYGPDENINRGEEKTYYAKDSVRIGFQEVLDLPYDQRSQDDLKNLIFDPSKDMDRGYGKPYGAYSYFLQNAHSLIALPNELPHTIYELTETLEDNPYQATNNNSLITTLQPTGYFDDDGDEIYQAKVIVNIWIEGWDADAFDAVLKDYIKIQLQFKSLLEPMV